MTHDDVDWMLRHLPHAALAFLVAWFATVLVTLA